LAPELIQELHQHGHLLPGVSPATLTPTSEGAQRVAEILGAEPTRLRRREAKAALAEPDAKLWQNTTETELPAGADQARRRRSP